MCVYVIYTRIYICGEELQEYTSLKYPETCSGDACPYPTNLTTVKCFAAAKKTCGTQGRLVIWESHIPHKLHINPT